MRLFQFDIHLGKYRVLIGTRDIQNGAVTTRCIADGAVTTEKIQDGAVTGKKIADKTIEGRHIADDTIKSRHIADDSITGDEIGPDGITHGNIADKAVGTRNIKDEAVTEEKLDKDLLNQIRSAGAHGYALSEVFGDSSVIGISQKALTGAFNRLWEKLEDITGESLLGIDMVVSPEYYVGEEGCQVHVKATTVNTTGIFEHIALYANGVLVDERDGVDYWELDMEIDETTEVKCVAKIMGVTYERKQVITHYSSFWLGAGSTYEAVMSRSNLRPIENGMRGAYNVNVAQGDRIIVVVGESLANGFIRADMNGVEIAFTESAVTVDDMRYRVFVSENTYQAGTYNVDING